MSPSNDSDGGVARSRLGNAYSYTPYVLMAFASMWTMPFFYALSSGLPVSEWVSVWAFSDPRIVQSLIWPGVFASLHVMATLAYLLRTRFPRFALLSYIVLFASLTTVAIYYFAVHGLSLKTAPLPFALATNLPPVALIFFSARQSNAASV